MEMRFKTMAIMWTAACVGVLAPRAPGQPFHIAFDVGFSDDTVGNAPVTQASSPSGVNTHPSLLAVSGAGNSIVVSNGYTDTGTGYTFGNGKVMVVIDDNDPKKAETYFSLHGMRDVSDGTVEVSFDYMVESNFANENDWVLFRARDASANDISGWGTPASTEGLNMRYWSGAAMDNTGNLSSDYVRGTSHTSRLVMDLDIDEATLYIDGDEIGTEAMRPDGVFHEFFMTARAAGKHIYAIDNVVIKIPLPATVCLVGFGLAGLWVRRLFS